MADDRILGLKKITKRDPIREALVYTPPPLTGGAFFFGKIGAGKTTGLLSICASYHDNPNRQYKIFDLWGGERKEQFYWTLPSTHSAYWNLVKKFFNTDKVGAKQYTVNLLFPYTRKLPENLPEFLPFVRSKIFTIPFRQVTAREIMSVKGVLTDTEQFTWREIIEGSKKTDTGANLVKKFEEFGAENTMIFKNFVQPLVREHLLQGDNCPYNLNLLEEMRNREAITVLCLNYVDPEFHIFVMDYILAQFNKLLNEGKIRGKNLLLIREASEFFKSDSSITPERYKVFKDHLKDYIRMGRKGVHMFLETQSPAETGGFLSGSEDFQVVGKLPSEADREFLTKPLVKYGHMTDSEVGQLMSLDKGEYFVIEPGKRVKKRYLFLPRCDYWREGDPDFINVIWPKRVDKWVNVGAISSQIETLYNESQAAIMQDEQTKKLIDEKEKKQKEEAEKQAQEKEDRDKIEREARRKALIDQKREEMKQAKKMMKQATKPAERKANNDQDAIMSKYLGNSA